MNKEEILSKVTESVQYIFDETESSVISDYSISPFISLKTGEEIGLYVTIVCGEDLVLTEARLNDWKERIRANDYMLKLFSSSLYLAFFVEYDKYGENKSDDVRISKWCINMLKATCDYDSPTSRKEVDDALAWLEKHEVCNFDALIDKAVSYIQQNWQWNNKIIEDFKNYMKGE